MTEPNAKTTLLTEIIKQELATGRLREGDVIEATLLKKRAREAYFDLGKFGTGIVFGAEFLNSKDILKNLEVGSRVPAKLLALEGEGGYTELSLTEASKQKTWQQIRELEESGEVTKFKVVGANAGGLVGTLIDLRAFLPVSQLSNEHYPKNTEGLRQRITDELKTFVGQELNVKIITANPRTNKIIVSERETLASNVKELLAQYAPGQVVEGVVSGIADFGIFVRFVDNPQIEGLIHISEIDHRVVDNPKEVVAMGETVKVKIIDIREGRVFLSLKALKSNPWETVGERYQPGQEVKGRVYKFNPFGAIIELEEGLQGMIHVSEFGGIEAMKAALPAGTSRAFVIDSIRPEEKRITLKLKKEQPAS